VEAMTTSVRTDLNATTGVSSRAATTTGWYGPAIHVFVIDHKYAHRRPPL